MAGAYAQAESFPMNCPFCKQLSEDIDEGPPFKIYQCRNHSEWLIEYPEDNPLYKWIGISNDEFLIELNISDQQTALYNMKETPRNPDDHSCIRMNYLIDLTPENAKQWIERLLKLKSFQ